MDPSTAVVVGVAQYRRRPALGDAPEPVEPARMMADVATQAAADAGDPSLVADADVLACVDPIAWGYVDLPGRVGELAGASRAAGLTVPPGGNSPGDLLNEVANRIRAGEAKVAIVAGAEAVYGRRQAKKAGLELRDWTPFEGSRDFLKGQRPLTNALEARHGLSAPIHCYPLFENALRAEAGRSVEEHQRYVSELMARNAAVAAKNPYAWFPTAWSPKEIREVTPDNRWVGFPYTKRMNAIMEVDQAAACVVVSAEEADRRGVAPERRVAFLGGASAVDAWTPTERPDFVSSPAYAAASAAALARAGVGVDDVDLFDLYSCFPSAVEFAMKALDLHLSDTRPFTVTGGLAYAGGPGNAYSMLALAAMVEELRAGRGEVGYVSALGMTATKHAVCVLSTDPELAAAAEGTAAKVAPPEALTHGPELVDAPDGPAEVETYTVEYDRAGDPVRTVVVLALPDGRRSVANGEATPAEVAALTEAEGVGRRGTVTPGAAGGEPNRFVLSG